MDAVLRPWDRHDFRLERATIRYAEAACNQLVFCLNVSISGPGILANICQLSYWPAELLAGPLELRQEFRTAPFLACSPKANNENRLEGVIDANDVVGSLAINESSGVE